MKDPHLGAMGAVTLMIALLAKWSALWVLAAGAAPRGLVALLLIPALARAQILLLALTTAPASETGMGAALRASLWPAPAWGSVGLCWLLAAWLIGWNVLAWAGLAGLLLGLWRASVRQRLGGFTGDTAGALVEMTEIALLLLVAVWFGAMPAATLVG